MRSPVTEIRTALSGGPGDDTLVGGNGEDAFAAGAGADTVNSKDNIAESAIDCGPDTDILTGDEFDASNNCEQTTLTVVDADGDGAGANIDCNDGDAAINPGALEIAGDNVDENCNGIKEQLPPPDSDGDTFDVTQDCDDRNPARFPGAAEVLGNTLDENCDGIASPFPVIGAGITNSFRAFSSYSEVTDLTVTRAPAGATIVVTCKTKKRSQQKRACPFATKTQRVTRPTARVRVREALHPAPQAPPPPGRHRDHHPRHRPVDDRQGRDLHGPRAPGAVAKAVVRRPGGPRRRLLNAPP